jgi:hypothetical protein
MAELLDPLVDREQTTHAEQHERDDERPEIATVRVAERVLGIGGLLSGPGPVEQQALVPGVRERVDRFSEQRRGTRDDEADELRDTDPEIREERGDDRPLRAVGRHGGRT